MALRVKNTFLSFEQEDEEEDERASGRVPSPPLKTSETAAPRSRSLDCASSSREAPSVEDLRLQVQNAQIGKLNRLIAESSSSRQTSPKQPGSCDAHDLLQDRCPSVDELRHLHRRLEEVCQPRSRCFSEGDAGIVARTPSNTFADNSRQFPSRGSTSPVTRVGMMEEGQAIDIKRIHYNLCNSLATSAAERPVSFAFSEQLPREKEKEPVEFSLAIEEPSVANTSTSWPSRSLRLGYPNAQERLARDTRMRRSYPMAASGPQSASSSPLELRGAGQHWQSGMPTPWESPSISSTQLSTPLEVSARQSQESVLPTTLMIRNLPNKYTQRDIIQELEELGFVGSFDFLYIPWDTGTESNLGYAFVNFVDPAYATRCREALQNYRFRRYGKAFTKTVAVSVAHIQGLEANLAHYEKSAVNMTKMKHCRPVVMANISSNISGNHEGEEGWQHDKEEATSRKTR